MDIYQYKLTDSYSGRYVIIKTTKEKGDVIKDFIEKVINGNDKLFENTPKLSFESLSNKDIICI